MKANEIVKDVMKSKGYSYRSLSEKIGKSTASAVSNTLSREKGMRIDTLMEMLNVLDCEVIIRDKITKDEWIIENNQ